MTADAPTGQTPTTAQESVGSGPATLKIHKPDLKSTAAELARRIGEIRRLIAAIEKAKTVSQGLLRREVSI